MTAPALLRLAESGALVVAGAALPLALRAEMWRACLPHGVARRAVLRWSAAAFSLNQLVGFRSGDVARAALAARSCGVRRGACSVGAFRAAELGATLLWAVAAGVSVLPPRRACALAAIAVAVMAAALLAARGRGHAGDREHGASLTLLAAALALPLLEVPFVLGVAHALGQPLGVPEAFLLVAAGMIGQGLGFLPLNALSVEASLAGALALLGHGGATLWTVPAALHAARLGLAVCLVPAVVSSIPFSELQAWAFARR